MHCQLRGCSLNKHLPTSELNLKPYMREFRSCCSELAELRDFIKSTLKNYYLSDALTNDIILAIDEAVTNIITHGYDDCDESSLKVGLNITGNKLVVDIVDYGKAFDISDHPELDIEAHNSSYTKGGLGIHLIKNLVDSIEYSSNMNGRTVNTLTLSKKLN